MSFPSHGWERLPLSNCTTPGHWNESTQIFPLLDAIKVRTGKGGRLRKHLKVITTDKGYDTKALGQQLRKQGIRARSPKCVWKTEEKGSGHPAFG